jgi:hypothetical protein
MTNFHNLAVDNSGLDPLSGYDFEVWAQYSDDGTIALVGKFQSLTVSFRNATETYIELGQRIPIYLDGEFQIAWVMEQGLVDTKFAVNTFGGANVRRDNYIGRSPRFHITFDMNAYELENVTSRTDESSIIRGGSQQAATFNPVSGKFEAGIPSGGLAKSQRKAQGRYELMRCKVDSVSMGAMAGRKVAAIRWEGVSEGYTYQENSYQEFKNQSRSQSLIPVSGTGNTTINGSGGGAAVNNTLNRSSNAT